MPGRPGNCAASASGAKGRRRPIRGLLSTVIGFIVLTGTALVGAGARLGGDRHAGTSRLGAGERVVRLHAHVRRHAPRLPAPRPTGRRIREAAAPGAQSARRHPECAARRDHLRHGPQCGHERLPGGLPRRDPHLEGAHARSGGKERAVRLERRDVLWAARHQAHQRCRVPSQGHCGHRGQDPGRPPTGLHDGHFQWRDDGLRHGGGSFRTRGRHLVGFGPGRDPGHSSDPGRSDDGVPQRQRSDCQVRRHTERQPARPPLGDAGHRSVGQGGRVRQEAHDRAPPSRVPPARSPPGKQPRRSPTRTAGPAPRSPSGVSPVRDTCGRGAR